ncbi:MAG: hypothetical protein Q9228_006406, partial [Teloschistes exilis]
MRQLRSETYGDSWLPRFRVSIASRFWTRLSPRGVVVDRVQTHTHTQDEGLYVVSGQCTFNAGGKDGKIATAGTFVNFPRLIQHSFTVDVLNTQLLNFYLPAGFEQLLTGIAHPADRSEPPPPDVPLAPTWLIEKLAENYGQTAILGIPFKDLADANNMKTQPTPGATLFPYALKPSKPSHTDIRAACIHCWPRKNRQ